MPTKKLMVCGCSYSAVSVLEEHKNTSWSEILASKLGFNLQNIARQGNSNGAIRIQIDEVIRQKPDFAIITPTSYDRIEIPNFAKQHNIFKDFQNLKNLQSFLSPINQGYGNYDDNKSYWKDAGLDNINYGHNNFTTRMIAETLWSLSQNAHQAYRKNINVPIEVQNALHMYITHLYDARWKRQIDEWIIRDGLVELIANNIPFLINPGFSIWESVKQMKEVLSIVIPEKYMLDNDEINPHNVFTKFPPEGGTKDNPYGKNDPGYHTTYEGQRYIANGFYELIKQRWNI